MPQVERFQDGDDYTTEERKVMRETRKILDREDLPISATCARVPVYTGHSVSANVQTRDPLSPDDCRDLLASAPGVTVVDDPSHALYPLALDAAGRDDVLVGPDPRGPVARALPEPLDRGRQPPQGGGHERRAAGRAADLRACCGAPAAYGRERSRLRAPMPTRDEALLSSLASSRRDATPSFR